MHVQWVPRSATRIISRLAAGLLWAGTALAAQNVVPVPAVIQRTPAEQGRAQKEVDQQLQQRVLGLVPNFFVVYTPRPVPLSSGQKFQLALRTALDPMAVAGAGVSAAYGQMRDDPDNFPQGAHGYGMRLATSYGANVFGTVTGRAIFPSLLKQDPRYFYKGTGSFKSRFYYAVSNSFICMGDNGRWQVNVSETAGSVATTVATEFQYRPSDRFDVERMFQNFVVSKAAYGARNLFQEFFSKRLTPGRRGPSTP